MNLLPKPDKKSNVVLYFQVHQPHRLKLKRFFEIGNDQPYFDEALNKSLMQRIARECYIPANCLILDAIKKHRDIKVAFSISGVTLEQFEAYAPEAIESFRALAQTGQVEFLAETFYHSLACLIPDYEFEIQVLKHMEIVERLFGVRPTTFRNTELIYSDEIGRRASLLGFTGIFTDGVSKVLHGRSVHQVYHHPKERDLKILLRNYLLSDDIAFRFGHHGKTLTVDQYLSWLNDIPATDQVITIGMDYETFGEHQKSETGIFDFFSDLLQKLSASSRFQLALPREVTSIEQDTEPLSVPHFVSWADQERDLSAWLGNDTQRDAFDTMLKLEQSVKETRDLNILKQWRLLQTSDHFYYMSTKKGSDGSVHNYFSPYPSPYEAFINYMNVLTDFSLKLETIKRQLAVRRPKQLYLDQASIAKLKLFAEQFE